MDRSINDLVETRIIGRQAHKVTEHRRGGWVMLVGGGTLQMPALRKFQLLGYRVAVTDATPECVAAQYADHFQQIDTYDIEEHVIFARSWPFGWQAIFTAGADPIMTVARVAEVVGCHAVPVAVAYTCHNKVQTRIRLEEQGVPQPDWRFADLGQEDDIRDLKAKIIDIGSERVIVKATGSSGSRGHTKGTQVHFEDTGNCTEALLAAATHSPSRQYLVEELLTGTELSVETLWLNGEMIPLNVVERPFADDPDWSLEVGHYNPWVAWPGPYQNVWEVAKRAGRAVGMEELNGGHIFKIDMIYTSDGPKVLEITTRLSGGFDSQWTTPEAHGADYTRGACLLALNRSLKALPYFANRRHLHAVAWGVWGPKEGGIIKEIRGVDKAEEIAHVMLRFAPGDILPAKRDCTARAAFVLTVHQQPKMALALAKRAVAQIEVVLE